MQMSSEQWAHLEIVGVVLVPITLYWLDTRHRAHAMHIENQTRLTRLETMIRPLWRWWNAKKGEEKGTDPGF